MIPGNGHIRSKDDITTFRQALSESVISLVIVGGIQIGSNSADVFGCAVEAVLTHHRRKPRACVACNGAGDEELSVHLDLR
jgi:DNA-binding LacI/PurR family transcriptional regulator